MIVKYAIEKSLLFNGLEEKIRSASFELNISIDVGGPVQWDDFATNSFEDLEAIIDSADYETIIKTGNFTIDDGFLHLQKGSDGLQLSFCKRDNLIIVFAFGETQPMRYKLYLEGVWVVG